MQYADSVCDDSTADAAYAALLWRYISELCAFLRIHAGEIQARFPASVSSLSGPARSQSPLLVASGRGVADRGVSRRRRWRVLGWPALGQSTSLPARLRRVVLRPAKTDAHFRPADPGRRPSAAVTAGQSLDGDQQRHAPVRHAERSLLAGPHQWRRCWRRHAAGRVVNVCGGCLVTPATWCDVQTSFLEPVWNSVRWRFLLPPRAWNWLPKELKLMRSTPVFKRSMKTFLFQTAHSGIALLN